MQRGGRAGGEGGGASIRCMCKCVTKEMVFKLLWSVIDYMFSPFFRRRGQIAEVRSKKGCCHSWL